MTPLPLIYLNLTGTEGDMVVEDSGLNGVPLNFSNGLIINGHTAFINLNNHAMAYLNVNLTFSVTKLAGIQSLNKTVILQAGLYSDQLSSVIPFANVTANQTSGNICLAAPSLNQSGDCPAIFDP